VQWFSFSLLDFSVSFLSILFEGAPVMFIGTVIAGFVDAFVPAHLMQRMLPRDISLAVGLGGVLGVVFPMCECGLIPVIRRMIGKGMPVSFPLTYLLSAPIINPIVGLSTIATFRGQRPIMTGVTPLGHWLCSSVHCRTDRGPLIAQIRSNARPARPLTKWKT
jgi:uncharacterized protein